LLRLLGSILFGALLGSGAYSYSYEVPQEGGAPGYYYYYYAPSVPAQPEPGDTL